MSLCGSVGIVSVMSAKGLASELHYSHYFSHISIHPSEQVLTEINEPLSYTHTLLFRKSISSAPNPFCFRKVLITIYVSLLKPSSLATSPRVHETILCNNYKIWMTELLYNGRYAVFLLFYFWCFRQLSEYF